MPTNDYLPFATGAGNNADSQANYLNSAYQQQGFVNGTAQPFQANKAWRQASVVISAVAQWIVNKLGINMLDDGNVVNFTTQFDKTVRSAASANNVVAFSTTPTFDLSLGDPEITLTGNAACNPVQNATPGLLFAIIVHQDATGGRTFAPPTGVPMDPIDPGANKTSSQLFKVGAGGVIYAVGPLFTQ